MVVLTTRGRDEVINIGKEILLTVIDIRGDKVRLGIEAPSEMPVHRREIYDILQNNYIKFKRLLNSGNYNEAKVIYNSLTRTGLKFPTDEDKKILDRGLMEKLK